MSVRLYAVLRLHPHSKTALPAGLRGESIRIVKCAGCSLAVADTRDVLAPSLDQLLDFDRVIRALAALSAAILPARFGALSETVTTLQSEIAERAGALLVALDNVEGRVQMTLRMPPGPPVKDAAVKGRRAKSGRGVAYLQARAAASNPPPLAKLRKTLAPLVRDERVEPGSQGTSVYHLIDSGDVAAYLARLRDYRVSGPFPPYAFVPGIDHAAWPGHDDQTSKKSTVGPSRSRARRRSARDAGR